MSTADDIKRLADEYGTACVLDERVTWDCRGVSAEEAAEEALNNAAHALHTAIDALQSERDALLEALQDALEFIEGYSDVSDGPYGEPKPNRAMQLVGEIEDAIKASEGKAA
jgi:ribosomal protein S11